MTKKQKQKMTPKAKTKKKTSDRRLTEKQKIFCREYIVHLNATRAAIAAGYSEKTAESQGSRLLSNVKVADYIQELMDTRAEKLEITADRVLQEIAKLAFSNMEDYVTFNDDGTASVDLSKLNREQAAAIQEITVDEYVDRSIDEDGERVKKIKFRLSDKGQNLERLGKHLKLFTDKVELTFTNLSDGIKAARGRARK